MYGRMIICNFPVFRPVISRNLSSFESGFLLRYSYYLRYAYLILQSRCKPRLLGGLDFLGDVTRDAFLFPKTYDLSLTQFNLNKFQIEKHLVFCRWQILVFHPNRLQWCSHGRSGFVGSLQSALQKRVLQQRQANPSSRVNYRELTCILTLKIIQKFI